MYLVGPIATPWRLKIGQFQILVLNFIVMMLLMNMTILW